MDVCIPSWFVASTHSNLQQYHQPRQLLVHNKSKCKAESQDVNVNVINEEKHWEKEQHSMCM
eukprot:748319-Hanusia_phi.AAC.12